MKQLKAALLRCSVGAVWLLVVLGPGGCGDQAKVVSLSNQDIAALTSDDIVRVMWRAGFSDDQILEVGTDLRNSLASTGAAKIMVGKKADAFLAVGADRGKKVEAMFSVNGDYVHAASRRRGNFIYDLKKQEFR